MVLRQIVVFIVDKDNASSWKDQFVDVRILWKIREKQIEFDSGELDNFIKYVYRNAIKFKHEWWFYHELYDSKRAKRYKWIKETTTQEEMSTWF